MLEAVHADLVSPSAWSAAPKIFSYPQAGPADYPIYWSNSGHWSVRALNGSVAIDVVDGARSQQW